MTATPATVLDQIAPGSRVVVRDQDWQAIEIERQALGTSAVVRCIGRSELVRDRRASFFSDIDRIEPEDPAKTRFRLSGASSTSRVRGHETSWS